jgi:hypothetical protein
MTKLEIVYFIGKIRGEIKDLRIFPSRSGHLLIFIGDCDWRRLQ